MTVQLWDAATGRPVGAPLSQPGAVAAAALSPDDRLVLTGCADGTARFWDVATSKPVGPRLVHGGDVHAVAFAHDGPTALTASLDGTVRRWAVPSELKGGSREILREVQSVTGIEGDPSGVTRALPAPALAPDPSPG
jgi:WD40 repeat protein